MSAAESMLDVVKRHFSAAMVLPVNSLGDVLKLGQMVRPLGSDFLLVFVDERFHLIDLWKVRRGPTGIQGFPTALAIQLAIRTGAAGLIVAQERDDVELAPTRSDLELTVALRQALSETDVELLDHFLMSGTSVRDVGGLGRRFEADAADERAGRDCAQGPERPDAS